MRQTATVLLIDDDTDDQEIFSYALGQADQSVRCVFANDGIHAMEKIKADERFVPDYIFIDMNMPRMNGKQCLAEIKKIGRLREIPVYIYSTSADPSDIQENLELGAADFIVKPSDVNDLTGILARILQKNIVPMLMLMFSILVLSKPAHSQQKDSIPSKDLKKLSVEQLMDIVVTSVTRSPEKLSEVASAIQVVSEEEIKRSGTLRLPGALRLASNLQVAPSGSHDTRITSRGFSGFPISGGSLANKLLVLIDGRSVYTPLFGGVFWDVQNVLQEDIRQIEVISGPGGAQWGSNAVNGIVNVISKSADETQGVFATVAAGSQLRDHGAVRYGSSIGEKFYYRAYAQRYDYNSTTTTGSVDAHDQWNITQAGVRTDYYADDKSRFTVQGDLYWGAEDTMPTTLINGQNILGRWTRNFTPAGSLSVQAYYDRTYRNIRVQNFIDELNTFDMEAQHNFFIGRINKVVWGLGYRLANNRIETALNDFIPATRNLQLFSLFIQDQVSLLNNHLELTFGTKAMHNDYTEWGFHPTVRAAWMPNPSHTLWGAISGAVRTPTRLEMDHPSTVLGSYGDFKSEKLVAYEIGYRVYPSKKIFFSLASFYNQYTDLRSIDTNATPPPAFYFGNNMEATTYGLEFSTKINATDWWKIRAGYTWIEEEFRIKDPKTFPESGEFEASDPKNRFILQSLMDITRHFQVDATVRYVDVVPAAITLPAVPSYITFDLRLSYRYKWATLTLAGANLAEKKHGSVGTVEIPRSGFAQLSVRF